MDEDLFKFWMVVILVVGALVAIGHVKKIAFLVPWIIVAMGLSVIALLLYGAIFDCEHGCGSVGL